MRQKTILFISPVGEFYGGGERSGFEFCRFLEKNNYKIITAIPKTSQTYRNTLDQLSMEYRLIDCNDFESQVMQGNPNFPRIVSQLMDIIKKDNIDIVITNLYAQAGPVAAILSGVPNVSMDRGQAYEDDFFSDFMAKFSDLVVVNSAGLADIYRDKYGINTPIVYSYTAKPEPGLDSSIEEQRIVCVSRISPDKNLADVLKAVKILKDRGYDKKILFIGPVPGPAEEDYKKQLESYIKENGLKDNVSWLGDQNSPWRLVGERDIYVNTSLKESVGRSNIEAIKLGVPSVIVDIPGHKDIIEKLNIVSYPEGQVEDLANKLQNIIDNYPESKNVANRAREVAEAWINEEGCNRDILPALTNLPNRSNVRSDHIFNYVLEIANGLAASLNEHNRIHSRELEVRDEELASHLGVKRSARLFAGNIKRRIQQALR